ncbi:uncharacterized protein RCC_06721 [Ramularia collo-cygni]|uniref:Extracellular membrane protein CFEM domain-containing protein n=1 Tax=Ramularia collo-cygni TaxID=112498 RepID=A0A2D3UVV4_9PEZI|nr:uncharacterized protein RCC_06721 [Ramularia collo-cygni]CZT20861.1 uncharacterized protein RCC_06721 [Ramularia collo-cygni]
MKTFALPLALLIAAAIANPSGTPLGDITKRQSKDCLSACAKDRQTCSEGSNLRQGAHRYFCAKVSVRCIRDCCRSSGLVGVNVDACVRVNVNMETTTTTASIVEYTSSFSDGMGSRLSAKTQ